MLALVTLFFGFTLWLGLYLIGRNIHKPQLLLAGLGLVFYAVTLGLTGLQEFAPVNTEPMLVHIRWLFIPLPISMWSGAIIYVLPAQHASRRLLARFWQLVVLPATGLIIAAGYFTNTIIQVNSNRVRPGATYSLFVALLLAFLVASVLLVGRARYARMRQAAGLLITGGLFFALAAGLLIAPVTLEPLLSPNMLVLLIGLDVFVLGLAIAFFDAFEEGERLRSDLLRSFIGTAMVAALIGLQVVLAMSLGLGVTFTSVVLLLGVVASAIVIQTLTDSFQSVFDRLAFQQADNLTATRTTLRRTASAASRLDTAIDFGDLPQEEFTRLTRRAFSYYADLPRLASSPLTRLPIIEQRLTARAAPDDLLERAAELKALLREQIEQIKPREQADVGTSDEWRYYNALYYPYIVGWKPYSRRSSYTGEMDADMQVIWEWFRTAVPERTLYNWQNGAAALIAQKLREGLD